MLLALFWASFTSCILQPSASSNSRYNLNYKQHQVVCCSDVMLQYSENAFGQLFFDSSLQCCFIEKLFQIIYIYSLQNNVIAQEFENNILGKDFSIMGMFLENYWGLLENLRVAFWVKNNLPKPRK